MPQKGDRSVEKPIGTEALDDKTKQGQQGKGELKEEGKYANPAQSDKKL